MSVSNSRYEATYSTAYMFGVPNMWVSCEGVRIESNVGFPFVRRLCAKLRAEGYADKPVVFFRDGESVPRYEFSSVYAAADGVANGGRIVGATTGKSPSAPYPEDISSALLEELSQAASLIGLRVDVAGLKRTLRVIEQTIAPRSVAEVNRMALRAGVTPRSSGDAMMQKRRTMAAIINAGKLADVL